MTDSDIVSLSSIARSNILEPSDTIRCPPSQTLRIAPFEAGPMKRGGGNQPNKKPTAAPKKQVNTRAGAKKARVGNNQKEGGGGDDDEDGDEDGDKADGNKIQPAA